MRFKTARVMSEYNLLPVENPRLYDLVNSLDTFLRLEFGKDVMLTSILRTKEEHEELYRFVPVNERPAASPHMFWEALDFRSSDFNDAQKARILSFLNQYKFRNGKLVALIHTVSGNVEHAHIQYAKVRV